MTDFDIKYPSSHNPTRALRPVFDELFAFKIGDHVCLRGELQSVLAEVISGDDHRALKVFTVLKRTVSEHHGGFGLQYTIRGEHSPGSAGRMSFQGPRFEYELAPYSEATRFLKWRDQKNKDAR